jgi:hypothetical protein
MNVRRHFWGEQGGWCAAVLFLTLAGSQVMGTALSPAPSVHEVDWRTSPLDLNLRGFNGERFCFRCPPGKAAAGQVIGSGPYTDGSSICAAAVHAGVLRAASGGFVTIEVRPGAAHFTASLSHFVQSEAYDKFWSGSFLVIAPGTAESTP